MTKERAEPGSILARLRQMHRMGYSTRKMAEELGFTIEFVTRLRIEDGISLPRRSASRAERKKP